MTMDPKIVEAIEEAVDENGQTKVLARRLVAWFDAIASGNQEINDKQSANRHLELLYKATKLEGLEIDYKMNSEYPPQLLREAKFGKRVLTDAEVEEPAGEMHDPKEMF